MRLAQRYSVSGTSALTVLLLIAWLAGRSSRPQTSHRLRLQDSSRTLQAAFSSLPLSLEVSPASAPYPIAFPAFGKHTQLEISAEGPAELLYLTNNAPKPARDAQCMFNGPRRLIGLRSDNHSALYAPFNNNTWVSLTAADGTVLHPSERFCEALLQARYLGSQDSVLTASLQPVSPPERPQHRCAHTPRWIGADCRVGSGARAVLADCITRDMFETPYAREAQCVFAHRCCHEIKAHGRPFTAVAHDPSTAGIFNATGGTIARLTGSRFDEEANTMAYAAADAAFRGYDPLTRAPQDAPTPRQNLWLDLHEAPGLSPRQQCSIDRIQIVANGAAVALQGAWNLTCL